MEIWVGHTDNVLYDHFNLYFTVFCFNIQVKSVSAILTFSLYTQDVHTRLSSCVCMYVIVCMCD